MQTLSYGYKKPQNGDKGAVWFPALEDDIQQLNDHTHNGTDSALIPGSSVAALSLSLASGGWVSQGNGLYRQLATLTGAHTFDNAHIQVQLTATGTRVYPTIEKVSSTTFYVYTNDNSVGYTVLVK